MRLDWGSPNLKTDLVTPRQIPTLFDGDRLTVYARVTGSTANTAVEVAVVADGPQGALRFPVNVDLERPTGFAAVPVLMARNAIRELEEGRGEVALGSNQKGRGKTLVEKKVLEIALRYQVLSSQSSFVAVEERTAGTQTERAELRCVPVALTKGWGGFDSALSAGMLGGTLGAGAFGVARSMAAATSVPQLARMDAPDLKQARRRPASPGPSAARSLGGGGFLDKLADAFLGGGGPSQVTLSEEGLMTDSLIVLTSCQRADGSFQFDEPLLTEMGIALDKLTAAAKSLGDNPNVTPIAHTALALALLATRFSSRRDEWHLVAGKAERWLSKQSLALPAGAADWPAWAAAQLGL